MQCRKCKKEILDTPFCQFCGTNQEPTKTNVKKRGNGQGYARKRGNVWQCEVNFISNGYRLTRTKSGFKTKKEALEYVGVLKNETEKPLKMIEIYNYWSNKHYENITKNKENAYKRAWNRLKPISHKEINSIRYDELQSIVDSADGYYPKKELRTVLHGVYIYAKKINQQIVDLSELLDIGKAPKADKSSFSTEEVKTMWKKLKDIPFLGYALIMIYTGMRPGELHKLTKEMIDFDKLQIIGAGIKTELGKNAPIVFPKKIKALLKKYDSFAWRKDKMWFLNNYKEALRQANINYLPPNCCRHTTATVLAELNISPTIIQSIMRHAKASTAMENYTHINIETKQDALQKL